MADTEAKLRITAQDETRDAFTSVLRRFDGLKSAVGGVAGAVGGLVGALAASSIAQAFGQVLETADQFNKLAQRTGVATEELSAYAYAARLANVNNDELADGLKKLAVRVTEAASGNAGAAALFSALGISVRDASGAIRGTDQILGEVASKFERFNDGPAKAALAVELFGKSGDKLIPFLNNFREVTDEGRKFGAIYGTEVARAAEQFNDNLTKLSISSEAAKVSIVGRLLPGLVEITNEFVNAYREGNKFVAVLKALGQFTGFVDTEDLARNRQFTNDVERLLALQNRLQELQKNESGSFGPNPVISRRIAETKEAIRELEANLKAQQNLRDAIAGQFEDQNDRRARQGQGKIDAPVVTPPKPEAKAQVDKFAEALKNLNVELAKVGVAGSKYEEVLERIRQGDFGKLSADQAAQLLKLAAAIDTTREAREQQKKTEEELARDAEERAKAQTEEQKRLIELAQTLRESIDPYERFAKVQRDLATAIGLTAEEADTLTEAAFGREFVKPVLDQIKAGKEETDKFASSIGIAFESAFSKAIVGGKKFGDVLRGLALDLVQLFAKQAVFKPLEGFVTNLASGIGPALAGIFGGARAGGGPVDQGRAYLVGEQGPELFVPSAAGTIVPNGSGQSVFIDARGADMAAVTRLERAFAQMNATFGPRAVAAVTDARRRGNAYLGSA